MNDYLLELEISNDNDVAVNMTLTAQVEIETINENIEPNGVYSLKRKIKELPNRITITFAPIGSDSEDYYTSDSVVVDLYQVKKFLLDRNGKYLITSNNKKLEVKLW